APLSNLVTPLSVLEKARSSASLVPGGAARRSPNRATGGAAGHETTRFLVVSPRVSVSAADHTIRVANPLLGGVKNALATRDRCAGAAAFANSASTAIVKHHVLGQIWPG